MTEPKSLLYRRHRSRRFRRGGRHDRICTVPGLGGRLRRREIAGVGRDRYLLEQQAGDQDQSNMKAMAGTAEHAPILLPMRGRGQIAPGRGVQAYAIPIETIATNDFPYG